MADLVVIAGVVAFFAICVAYVAGCDRIIGTEPPEGSTLGITHEEATSITGGGR